MHMYIESVNVGGMFMLLCFYDRFFSGECQFWGFISKLS